jgi:hypothetical protein
MISNLWWARNSTIFKDKWVPREVIAAITLNQDYDFKDDPKFFKKHTPILPTLDYDIPCRYFDGASEGHPPSCKVGVVLFINHNHYIYIRYSPSQGSNNRAKLIAM